MSDWEKDKKEGINCFWGVDTEKNLTNDLSIDVQFAVYLCNSNRLGKFETWFNNISKCNSALIFDLMKNEDFCLCIVRLKIFQKKYDQAFKLLESGPFSAKEEYVKLWEDAHYKQKEAALGQPLTPLQRFRLRKRFPPPVNICPSGRQIINPLFKEASVILKHWYQEHSTYPYPSVKEKQMLAQKTGLTLYQVKTWFANTRRRKKIHQMQSSLQHHKLLNKKLFLFDSEQLVEGSSKALDLSIQILETKADQESASSDQAGGMYTDAECLLKQANKKTHADLKEKSREKWRNENSQNVAQTSHKCCFYCSDFEASLHETDQNEQQSVSNSETGTFLNTNLGTELSEKQNFANIPNSSKGRKNSDLINMFMPQHMSLEANLNKNKYNFKPHSSSEELTKPINPQQSEVRFQILNKTIYSPLHLPSVNVSQQQQVTTNCCDSLSIPSPTPSQFLTNITQTPTDFICPNPTIYPIPIVTTKIDPSVNLGVFRQDRSYHPSRRSSVNSSMMLNQEIQNTFQNNFDSHATTTESIPYSTNPNLNSSCMSEYPVSNTLHPATETLAFGVACPPLPSTTSINHHLQIIQTSNLQAVQMNKEDWNQLTRSCGQSPATGHNIMTLGTSISQMPQNLDGVTRKKELMNIENEIAHTLLRLARNVNKAHMSNQGQ